MDVLLTYKFFDITYFDNILARISGLSSMGDSALPTAEDISPKIKNPS